MVELLVNDGFKRILKGGTATQSSQDPTLHGGSEASDGNFRFAALLPDFRNVYPRIQVQNVTATLTVSFRRFL
jgi:DNA-binding transcriptional LysR family regulator